MLSKDNTESDFGNFGLSLENKYNQYPFQEILSKVCADTDFMYNKNCLHS